MTQIIKCIHKYLHKTNTFLLESPSHFIFLPFPAVYYTQSCIKVPSKFLCASQMPNPKKTDNASMVEWFGIMLEGWIVQHVWDHLKKTISVSPSKAAPSFSGGHLKSLSLKCQPQQQWQQGTNGVRNTAKNRSSRINRLWKQLWKFSSVSNKNIIRYHSDASSWWTSCNVCTKSLTRI